MITKRSLKVSIQVLPLTDDVYRLIDKAIEAIQSSGVKYEVGPLETTLEGDDLDQLLGVAKSAHHACFEGGANKVVTIVKIAEELSNTLTKERMSK